MEGGAHTVTSTTADAAAATADAAGAATDQVLAQLAELQGAVANLASANGGKATPASDPTHAKLAKQGTLFKMSDISVDVDGDGKVSEDESKVHEWLQSMAVDGKIRAREFYGMMAKVADQQKQKRRTQKLLALAGVMIVLLVVAIFGAVWGVNAAFLNKDKK